jgi:DNA-binding NarL/FixJ family response regulator
VEPSAGPQPARPLPARPLPARPLRLLLVDAHEPVREGLRTLLADEPDLRVAGEAADAPTAVALARRLRPDVIVLEVVLPGADGVATIRRLRAVHPAGRILVLTGLGAGRQVREALAAGATGYVLKDVLWADLCLAIRRVGGGRSVLHPEVRRRLRAPAPAPGAARVQRLSEAERALLARLSAGAPDAEIAAALGCPPGAVRRAVARLLSRLGVPDRSEAMLIALDHRLAALAALA